MGRTVLRWELILVAMQVNCGDVGVLVATILVIALLVWGLS